MDNKIATFTFFMLFAFTVSAGRLHLDPPATNPPRESLPIPPDSNIRLPGEKPKSEFNESTTNNPLPKSENITNDLTQRTNSSRFHPINRHFRGKPPKQIETFRRPYRKSVSRNRFSGRNDEIGSRRAEKSNSETFSGEVPSNWLKAEQYYRSRRHRSQPREKNENVMKTRNVFDREKLKSLRRQHKQKKIEEETGFMKNIRKFLKHTFD